MSTDIHPVRERENASASPMAPEAKAVAGFDWSAWELEWEDDVGQGVVQELVIHALLSILRAWVSSAHPTWFVGSDTFFAWVPANAKVRVSPDVYVLPQPRPADPPESFQIWEPGVVPPLVAIEVVSSRNARKDFEQNPEKYDQLGVQELVIFDPRPKSRSGGGTRITQWTRGDRGRLVQTYAGNGATRSSALGLWWQVREIDGVTSLRLSRDQAGTDLLPTDAEARRAEAEARRAEARRAESEAEARRAAEAREREAEARERAAEEEVARLRALLAAKGGA